MSDYETIQRRRNILVGVFVVAGMCALVWLIFKFGDLPIAAGKLGAYQIFVQFPSAAGVQRTTPVRFCGYQIGSVTRVEPPKVMRDLEEPTFYHQTLVVLSIDNKYKDIPADVEAKLMTRGFGSSFIELKLTHFDVNEPAGPFLVQGSKLQGSSGITSEFFPEETQEMLVGLVADMRTFVNNANDILGDPNNKENFNLALADLAKVSGEAASRLREAKQTLQHVNRTLQVASEAIEDARPAIGDFRGFIADANEALKSADAKAERLVAALADTTGQLSRSLSELRVILEKVNSGEGSAARFLNDGKFYETMLENAEEMEMLLKEIRAFVSRAREKGLPLKLK